MRVKVSTGERHTLHAGGTACFDKPVTCEPIDGVPVELYRRLQRIIGDAAAGSDLRLGPGGGREDRSKNVHVANTRKLTSISTPIFAIPCTEVVD